MVKLIRFDDQNVSEDDIETYQLVVETARRFSVDPSMSIEAENFFSELVTQYEGDKAGLVDWLEEQIPQYFVAIGERPRWLQNPEWPFADGRPMIFAGQIDWKHEEIPPEVFHDNTSLYVFIGRKTRPVVVIQQV